MNTLRTPQLGECPHRITTPILWATTSPERITHEEDECDREDDGSVSVNLDSIDTLHENVPRSKQNYMFKLNPLGNYKKILFHMLTLPGMGPRPCKYLPSLSSGHFARIVLKIIIGARAPSTKPRTFSDVFKNIRSLSVFTEASDLFICAEQSLRTEGREGMLVADRITRVTGWRHARILVVGRQGKHKETGYSFLAPPRSLADGDRVAVFFFLRVGFDYITRPSWVAIIYAIKPP